MSHIGLAFIEHERGEGAAARRHIDAAQALIDAKEPVRTELWAKTIPGWLTSLKAELGD